MDSIIFGLICVFIGYILFEDDILIHKKWIKTVPYTKLVWEVILFTGSYLHKNGIKQYPTYSIRYDKTNKKMGIFYPLRNEIVIYVNSHSDIPELVDTVLHEIFHSIQYSTAPTEFGKYEEYKKVYGSRNNPLEVECRKFGEKWTQPCLKYLETKRLIERK